MYLPLDIFRRHKILDHLDPNILVSLDGTAEVNGAKFITNRVSSVEISKASQIIIQIQPTDVFFLHHPS